MVLYAPQSSTVRLYFFLVDATDLSTPETGESGGQPQITVNEGAYQNTVNTLVAIGQGRYYVELDSSEKTPWNRIRGRYKSANTDEAETKETTVITPEDPLTTSDIPTESEIASQVRTELSTELARIDADVSSRLATSGYTAPDNAGIAAVQAKTDNLPADPVSSAELSAMEGAIRGADDDTLKTLSDQLDLVDQPVGIRQVTITVVDGDAAPVPEFAVAIYDETNTTAIRRGVTNASGDVVFSLDDGNYNVRLGKTGYEITTPQALTVDEDDTVEYTADAWVPTAPTAPDKCVLYDWVVDAAGQPVAGATVKVYAVVPGSAGNRQLANPIVTRATDNSGYVEFELVREARVAVMAPSLGWEDTKKTVPDAASQRLSTW